MKTNWKIISDFMYTDGFEHPKIDGSLPFGDYHNSWDWLMPVVKKIESKKDRYEGKYMSRPEARTAAIEKANEIYNEK